MFPLVLTWATDIGAYFVGRAIGGRKLIPAVSPGKTVSGRGRRAVATMLVVVGLRPFVLRPFAQLDHALPAALVFGASISVAAQVGDLAESLLKREAGVKDSSRLIPGHGGVLDRLDSLLFVLPVAYLLLGWLLLPAAHRDDRAASRSSAPPGRSGRPRCVCSSDSAIAFASPRSRRSRTRALLEEQAAHFAPGVRRARRQRRAMHARGWRTGRECLVEAATRRRRRTSC